MNNFNLKYLIIGVITISILIVAGAFIFSLLNKQSFPFSDEKGKPKITSPPVQQSQEATQSAQQQSEPQVGRAGGGDGAGASDEKE